MFLPDFGRKYQSKIFVRYYTTFSNNCIVFNHNAVIIRFVSHHFNIIRNVNSYSIGIALLNCCKIYQY